MPVSMSFRCGHCGDQVLARVVAGDNQYGTICFAICPSCSEGIVKLRSNLILPHPKFAATPSHLEDDVAAAWMEAQASFGAGAYTAAEIMCRKILMHVAVDKAGSAIGKSFVSYVDDLDKAGYVTPGLKPIVDGIRERGNKANHELDASTLDESTRTMKVALHLLKTVYELPNM